MGMAVPDAWMGGGGCVDFRNVLHCGSSGCTPIMVGSVGHVPADW